MAVVEQKCADDIPLHVDGERHFEGFEGQVAQYRQVLTHLKALTGHAPHLIAICQPGPLLISTLILNPELGRTFGSAGSPMHTEAQSGFLTDFARLMGPAYIDLLMCLAGRRVGDDCPGVGREAYDGSYQVLGFYLLGLDQHYRNLKRFLADVRQGDQAAAERQASFYQWYNFVHHFPAGFIRDTYKKIFAKNELVRGTLVIGGQRVAIENYPDVPIWALGGANDDIAPALQATGHMDLIDLPSDQKLSLTCDAGHMGLFRAKRILKDYYSQITEFILANSDYS
jgi:polyhydroxyalkanoate depolymerase